MGHPHARHPEIDKINICLGNDAPGPLQETLRQVSVLTPLPPNLGYQKQIDGVRQDSQAAAKDETPHPSHSASPTAVQLEDMTSWLQSHTSQLSVTHPSPGLS